MTAVYKKYILNLQTKKEVMNMINFYGATEGLVRKLSVLKERYPNDVFIEDYSDHLKTINICNGVPVILKYYGFDNQLRVEIGSFLSDAISSYEYVNIEMA